MLRPPSPNPRAAALLAIACALLAGATSMAASLLSEPPSAPAALATDAALPAWLGPQTAAVGPDGRTIYIGTRAGTIHVLNASDPSARPALLTRLPAAVRALATLPDGTLVAATGGIEGTLHRLAPDGRPLAAAPAGHTPDALAAAPDGRTLYVALRFEDAVSVRDATTLAERTRWSAPREPAALALSPDGRHLVVAGVLPEGPASASPGSQPLRIHVFATASGQDQALNLPPGSMAALGAVVAPDGAHAYVTHLVGRNQMPTNQIERGWIMTNAVSILALPSGPDLATASSAPRLVNTVLLDQAHRGAANPWGVAATPDGARLVVAAAGSHAALVLDLPALHARLAAAAAGERDTAAAYGASGVPFDLGFTTGLAARLALPVRGPRPVVIAAGAAFLPGLYTDAVARLPLSPASPGTAGPPVTGRPTALPLGPPPDPATLPVLAGDLAFHDAGRCLQEWLSCASCHPGEARADGLNWDLLNDGVGNPKQSKSLLLSLQTPPAMVTGIRPSGQYAVRSGLRHIQFIRADEETATALETYLASLQSVPAPPALRPPDAVSRGRDVFARARCLDCHPPPLYTDLKAYDVGTAPSGSPGQPLDTPTLVEVWRTAPYLHDGRSATLRDVLVRDNPADTHGLTAALSPAEIDDLLAYLLSL